MHMQKNATIENRFFAAKWVVLSVHIFDPVMLAVRRLPASQMVAK